MQEGALRVSHVLGPLLALPHKSPCLHKALSRLHVALQVGTTMLFGCWPVQSTVSGCWLV